MKHPQQPMHVAPDGTTRFVANPLVRYLLDRGSLDLNDVAYFAAETPAVTDDDQMQLAQLIGYSIVGYCELSYVSDESYEAAIEAADAAEAKHRATQREATESADSKSAPDTEDGS